MSVERICSVDGCESPVRSRGMCKRHYERMRIHGNTTKPSCRRCGKPLYKMHALHCNACAQVDWRERQRELTCVIDGCRLPRRGVYGLCDMHASRKKRHGDPLKALRVKGVRSIRSVRAGGVRRFGRHERGRWEQKLAYWGHACWMCGAPWEHVDHVKPTSRGGADLIANLRPACASCNHSKSDRWPFDTRRRGQRAEVDHAA